MLIALPVPGHADRRDELLEVLVDFHIDGELVAADVAGSVHRYRYALTGAKKVSRVAALAPDIAREMGALSASIRALDNDGLIEIALVTEPYLPTSGTGTHRWFERG